MIVERQTIGRAGWRPGAELRRQLQPVAVERFRMQQRQMLQMSVQAKLTIEQRQQHKIDHIRAVETAGARRALTQLLAALLDQPVQIVKHVL